MSEAASGPIEDNASEETVTEEQASETETMSLDDALAHALSASDQSEEEGEEVESEEDDTTAEAEDHDDDEGEPEEAAAEEDAADADAEDEPDGEDEEPLSAPDHWPAEKREAFNGLPNEAKAVLLDQSKALEAQFTRKNQELSEDVRFAEAVKELSSPYEQQLRMQGMTTLDGIRQLVGLNDYYQKDPVGYIKYVAQAAGIDLASLNQQPAEGDEYADPQLAALTQKVQSLEAQTMQRQQSEQSAMASQAQAAIQQFASETDEKGQLKRPYFEQVRERMSALLLSQQVTTLEDAYEEAKWSDPTIRAQMTAAQEAKAKADEEAKRKAALEKAKRNKRKAKSTAPPQTAPVEGNDLDSIIKAAQAKYA